MPEGRRFNLVLSLVAALLFAASGCATPATSATASAYFYRVPPSGAPIGSVEGLIPVARTVTARNPTEAVTALLAGPTPEESAAGISTAIPAGTTLLGVTVTSGVATVNLSGSYDDGGGSMSIFVRLDQLLYTVTQFSEITGVTLQLDGLSVKTFSSEGLELASPMKRTDAREQLPAIFVDAPAWGGALGNPAEVRGIANVFEAQFRVEVLDESELSLIDTPVMATCGTGCWGTFDELIPYEVSVEQWGTLRVYEASAKDGSPINIVDYRVRLTPRVGE